MAIVGLALRHVIEGEATKDLRIIAGAILGIALLLLIAEWVALRKRDMKDLKWSDALVVGVAQCISLVPGSSRSGTIITAGLLCWSDLGGSRALLVPALYPGHLR